MLRTLPRASYLVRLQGSAYHMKQNSWNVLKVLQLCQHSVATFSLAKRASLTNLAFINKHRRHHETRHRSRDDGASDAGTLVTLTEDAGLGAPLPRVTLVRKTMVDVPGASRGSFGSVVGHSSRVYLRILPLSCQLSPLESRGTPPTHKISGLRARRLLRRGGTMRRLSTIQCHLVRPSEPKEWGRIHTGLV